MTTQEVANRLVELCRKGQFNEAQDELYSDDAVSAEPAGTPWGTVTGKEAMKAKGEKWGAMMEEMHAMTVSDPIIADDHFAVSMFMDITMKGEGRSASSELCVYTVKDGKVVREEFFYNMPPQEG